MDEDHRGSTPGVVLRLVQMSRNFGAVARRNLHNRCIDPRILAELGRRRSRDLLTLTHRAVGLQVKFRRLRCVRINIRQRLLVRRHLDRMVAHRFREAGFVRAVGLHAPQVPLVKAAFAGGEVKGGFVARKRQAVDLKSARCQLPGRAAFVVDFVKMIEAIALRRKVDRLVVCQPTHSAARPANPCRVFLFCDHTRFSRHRVQRENPAVLVVFGSRGEEGLRTLGRIQHRLPSSPAAAKTG